MQCLQPDTLTNECLKESLMVQSYGGMKMSLEGYEEFYQKVAEADNAAIQQFLKDNPSFELDPF